MFNEFTVVIFVTAQKGMRVRVGVGGAGWGVGHGEGMGVPGEAAETMTQTWMNSILQGCQSSHKVIK